jgi:hypothetical protein
MLTVDEITADLATDRSKDAQIKIAREFPCLFFE